MFFHYLAVLHSEAVVDHHLFHLGRVLAQLKFNVHLSELSMMHTYIGMYYIARYNIATLLQVQYM